MNAFELFSVIYIALEADFDKNSDDFDFVQIVSAMDPFSWSGIRSVDQAEFERFRRYAGTAALTACSGYDIARMYLARHAPKVVSDAFGCCSKERWLELCIDYLSQEHKGGEVRVDVDTESPVTSSLPYNLDDYVSLAKEMEGKTLKEVLLAHDDDEGMADGTVRVKLGRFSLDLFNEWHPICVDEPWPNCCSF